MPAGRLARQTRLNMVARENANIISPVISVSLLSNAASTHQTFRHQSHPCFHTNRNLPTLPFGEYLLDRFCAFAAARRCLRSAMNIARIVCTGVLLLAGSAAALDGGKVIEKTTISLGTATPGGGFPLYGGDFAEVMNDADSTL